MALEKNNLRIELAIFRFLGVKNFDRSPAMLKIFALIKRKIANFNLRILFISKFLSLEFFVIVTILWL